MIITPAHILGHILVANGLLDDPAMNPGPPVWPCFKSYTPDTPDKCVTALNTDPFVDAILLNGRSVRQWGLQLWVRSGQKEHDEGWGKAMELANWIETARFKQVNLETVTFVMRSAIVDSGPLDLGREPNTRRCLFSVNILANLGTI